MLSRILIDFISDYLHILIFIDVILFWIVYKLFKTSFRSLSDKLIKNKIGLLGELRVLNELKMLDLPLMHDVYIPMANSNNPTQIDILVRLYDSILVVEVKNIGGFIKGTVKDQKWLSAKGTHRHVFYNPIMQNNVHCHAVMVMGESKIKLQSAVVFCGNAKFGESLPDNVFTLKTFMEYVKILKKSQLKQPHQSSLAIFSHKTDPHVESTWSEIRSYQGWLSKKKLIKQHKAITIKKYYQKITALKYLFSFSIVFIIFLGLTYVQYIDVLPKYIHMVIQYINKLINSF